MPRPATAPPLRCAAALCAGMLVACAGPGSRVLEHDQVDYARAVDRAQKGQTLSNIVSLRYADTPSFLSVTQIIAAYNFDGSLSATVSGSSVAGTGTQGVFGATLAYSNRPTFTFVPATGEELAAGYIRPLAPAQVLPLVQSGVPVDLLLRIVAQSIGTLQNSAALSANDNSGSEGFFELLHALRRLQLRGALSVRFEKGEGGSNHVFIAVDPARMDDVDVARDALAVRRLLQLPAAMREVEVVYGATRAPAGAIGMITRSVIGILTELGAQIDVPAEDVDSHATVPTVRFFDIEKRPTIVVRVGAAAPADAFAAVRYGPHWFWIEHSDFDSKFAFSVVQNLIALAETGQNAKAPIVTIPAN